MVQFWLDRYEPVWFTLGMKLEKYLKIKKLSPEAFGEMIDATATSVRRYIKGTRKPCDEKMARIKKATGGKVTANDFYGCAEC